MIPNIDAAAIQAAIDRLTPEQIQAIQTGRKSVPTNSTPARATGYAPRPGVITSQPAKADPISVATQNAKTAAAINPATAPSINPPAQKQTYATWDKYKGAADTKGMYYVRKGDAGGYNSGQWRNAVAEFQQGYMQDNNNAGGEWREVTVDNWTTRAQLEKEGYKAVVQFQKKNSDRVYYYKAPPPPPKDRTDEGKVPTGPLPPAVSDGKPAKSESSDGTDLSEKTGGKAPVPEIGSDIESKDVVGKVPTTEQEAKDIVTDTAVADAVTDRNLDWSSGIYSDKIKKAEQEVGTYRQANWRPGRQLLRTAGPAVAQTAKSGTALPDDFFKEAMGS